MNRRRLGGPLGTLAAVAAGGTVGSMVPIIGIVGTLAGIAAGAALVGAVAGGRRYVGVALAGAVTMVALVGLSTLTSLLAPVAIGLITQVGPAVGVGAGAAGALSGIVGHYVGRDVRAGLTRPV
ncbi:MAG: hypothetical protein RI560_13640 [Natronomonas sp.]|nr:hypothetical protein [Natronomonas sp.]